MNTHRIKTKANSGVGGIKCPCCRAARGLKEARILHNRAVRRYFERLIRVEVNALLVEETA